MAGLGAVERDDRGCALWFRGINLDVTERKRGEELLRENLRLSEQIAHVGHWMWETTGRRLVWSDQLYRIFRVDPATFEPGIEVLASAVHPDDRMRAAGVGELLLCGRLPEEPFECRIVVGDGSTRHLLGVISTCQRDSDGTITLLAGIVHDVTDRRIAEAEVLRIGEEERQRIAADLHDGVLQELAGIAYLTASVRAELEASDPHAAARVQRIETGIVQAIDHARQLACAVDPMLPSGNGLSGALRHFATSIEGTYGVCCVVEPPPRAFVVDDPVTASQLFRIAQEAVRNAVRHGKAKHVVIRLDDAHGELSLRVLDDGAGMGAAGGSPGLGLHVMRYRAELIGGRLAIRARAEGGTEVLCRFPPATASTTTRA
jgi:signal transduction histidine kinase